MAPPECWEHSHGISASASWRSTGIWSLAARVQIPALPPANLGEVLISLAQLPHL